MKVKTVKFRSTRLVISVNYVFIYKKKNNFVYVSERFRCSAEKKEHLSSPIIIVICLCLLFKKFTKFQILIETLEVQKDREKET